MNVFVALCHPLQQSFNGRIAQAVCGAVRESGQTLIFHDLYRESFNPVLTGEEMLRGYSFDEQSQRYMDEVMDSDVLIFIHPDWWGQMPALLKGFFDRVFRSGIVYDYSGNEFLEKRLERLMAGKRAMAFCTTDSEESASEHPLESIWRKHIFEYCGIQGRCELFHSIRTADTSRRKAIVETAAGITVSVLEV